jgi:hypothetical protein
MADPFAPVASGIIPPDPNQPLKTMSSIFGIQQQKQQLQLQAQELQRSQVQTQQAQGVNNFFSQVDPNQIHGDDGTLDLDKIHARPEYQSLPGVAKIAVDSQANQLRGQQLQNKMSLAQLNGEVVGQLGKVGQGLSTDPDVMAGTPAGIQKVKDTLGAFAQLGEDNKRAVSIYQPNIAKVMQSSPTRLAGAVGALGSQAQSVSEQQQQTNPESISTNAGAVNRNKTTGALSQPPGGATGSAINPSIAPGYELTEDPLTHNKYLWNRQTGQTKPFGAGAPTGGASASPSAPNLPPQAPPQRQIGEAEAQGAQVNTNFQAHQANVKAASAANQQLDQIKNVANLLDQGVKTGSGAQAMSQAEQALSNVPGLSGLAGADSQAAKFDLLNKFLERIGADYGSLNGSPAKTDAGAESLRSQIGSTGYNPQALRDVMKYTAAQYQAAKSKDTAEQNFFSQPGNGILNQDQFEKQWRNSYEPRVYQLANEPKDVAKTAIQNMAPADRATFLKKYAELKTMGAAPQ